MLIYMTQIDKQNKVPTEQPTLIPENDRKMKIKRRSINNTLVHFSFTFLIICSIFLSFFSICALKKEFISLRGIMVIISVLLINAAAVTATYCEIDNNSQ